MFDPKSYKDEWTPAQKAQSNTSASGSNQNTNTTVGDLVLNEKKDDFRHIDGTKAEVEGEVANKYNGLDFEKKDESKKSDDVIDEEAEEIVGPELPSVETKPEPALPELGVRELEMAEPSYEETTKEEKPEATNSDGKLEDLLSSKANAAISKLEEKKKEKKELKAKLDKEIAAIDEKIDELNSLTEDLKNKLKQFDSELN